MKKVLSVFVIAAFISACSTASKDISATYISPLQYKDYNCDQLTAEMQRVAQRVTEIGGRLDQAASNDKTITGVGVILFWPALFALGGTKQQEADYARLRGEYDAINQAAIQKDCKLTIQAKPAVATQPATASADEAKK